MPKVERAKSSIEVHLLGQNLVLKAHTEAEAHHLDRVASFVKKKVDELARQGPISSSKLALLVALNVADDYLRNLEDTRVLKQQIAAKSRALLNELDS